MDDAGVAGAERLQFRPAVDFSLDETDGLDRLQHAAVVEIGQAAIPAPAAAREAELLARLNVGRDAVFHVLELAGALPEKMTFAQGESVRDVADVNVEQPVAVDVAEVAAHALEGILAEHARLGIGETAPAFQHGEFQVAGRGFVVQQPVGAEIVREINFRQLVAVQVRRADGQRPAVIHFRADDVGHLEEMHGGMFARGRALPRGRNASCPPESDLAKPSCIASTPPAFASRMCAPSWK